MDTKSCLAISSFMVFLTVELAEGIQCYRCTVHPPVSSNATPQLCQKFNETPLFEVNCPYSNYCMKKTFSLPLNSKDVVITLRDCAHQKEMHLVEKDGISDWEARLGEDVYKEGCYWKDNTQKSRITPTQMCYCKDHLCNGHANKNKSQHTDIMAVILAYNAIKYVRSFQ